MSLRGPSGAERGGGAWIWRAREVVENGRCCREAVAEAEVDALLLIVEEAVEDDADAEAASTDGPKAPSRANI